MPAGGFSVSAPLGTELEAKITPAVVASCVMAATGGLIFGYDIGISGGVTSMDDFLREFFPTVLEKKKRNQVRESKYCKYDDQGLQLFTSSLYLAALAATLFAAYTTRRLGRRTTMLLAGVLFVVGAVVNGAAKNLAMLVAGRILLGCGVGFSNQASKNFFSLAGPSKQRGIHQNI
uniref:Major facilitator superfamily (MFS) profile domain-containing protein n=1 Tax=Oryza brachyantha TaxID=4533 RepID=J3NA32_ORYBR